MAKKMASVAQLFELLAAIVRQFHKVSDQIPSERAQFLIENQDQLGPALLTALLGTVASLWQTLLTACKQAWVNDDFTEANYPLEPVSSDEEEWEVYEHHFAEPIIGEKAFSELEKLGYRLLNGSRRAMQFVAEHPDIQLDHPLVVTARWQGSDGCWCAPVFRRDCGERCLRLCWLDFRFFPDYGWLVLRRKQKS